MRPFENGKQELNDSKIYESDSDSRPNTIHGKRNFNARLSLALSKIELPSNCKILDDDKKYNTYGSLDDKSLEEIPKISDIIGSFGWFQFCVLIFSGLREMVVGYDAVVMSIVLKEADSFICADTPRAGLEPVDANHQYKNSSFSNFNATTQCYQTLNGRLLVDPANNLLVDCKSWIFFGEDRILSDNSLTVDWSLVCDRTWLIAFIESAYFFGLVLGNLTWGYLSDKYGRCRIYIIAHTIALVAGLLSIMSSSVEVFLICRFFCAFGAVGYNIIYSIQIELIGTEYRSMSTTLNHLGWGIGVIGVPIANHLFSNYKHIIAVAPVITLIMFPWALFWLPESCRWLMANNKYEQARKELVRAARFNGKKITTQIENKISLLNDKICRDKILQETENQKGTPSVYKRLISSPKLVKNTIALSYLTFTGHLFYYLLTINFLYIGLSANANFIITGAGEWAGVILGVILFKFLSRKSCMSVYAIILTLSFIVQSISDAGLIPFNEMISIVNNAAGTLSSLMIIFVVLIVNQEVYPTLIRQTGSSLVNTIGEMGSTLAPIYVQMSLQMGLWRSDILSAVLSLTCLIAVRFVTKTDEMELTDS